MDYLSLVMTVEPQLDPNVEWFECFLNNNPVEDVEENTPYGE